MAPTRNRSALRTLGLAMASMAVSVLATLIVAELALQFLPVRTGLNAQPVNQQSPVFRFEPDTRGTFSKDWDMALANHIRTNNAGFVNLQDYDPDGQGPLLAIIGDSYIEAAMVPETETVHARLQQRFGEELRVYSFAASGAGLAQYFSWAEHARDVYKPDYALVSIISNDFSEALWERERNPGFHGFKPAEDGGYTLELAPYQPSLPRQLLRNSALARYLVLNLRVLDLARTPLLAGDQEQRWIGNVAAQGSPEFVVQAEWATRIFLDNLPARFGLPPERIMIAVDGVRPQLYTEPSLESVADAYWPNMRRYMLDQARARGYHVEDLNEAFVEDFAEHGRRFEFERDSHWNGEGHRVLAERAEAWLSERP